MKEQQVKDGPEGSVAIDPAQEDYPGKQVLMDREFHERLVAHGFKGITLTNPNNAGRLYAVIARFGRLRNVMLHRLVLPGVPRVGFKNGDTLDCRKENLIALPYGANPYKNKPARKAAKLLSRARKLADAAEPVQVGQVPLPGSRKQRGNRCEVEGNVAKVDVSTPQHRNAVMLIDKADWERESPKVCRFFAHDTNSSGRLFARAKYKGTTKTVQVHRLLRPDLPIVRFKNDNTLDCRRENLCSVEEKLALPPNPDEIESTPVARTGRRKVQPVQAEVDYLDREFLAKLERFFTEMPHQEKMVFGKRLQAAAEAEQRKEESACSKARVVLQKLQI